MMGLGVYSSGLASHRLWCVRIRVLHINIYAVMCHMFAQNRHQIENFYRCSRRGTDVESNLYISETVWTLFSVPRKSSMTIVVFTEVRSKYFEDRILPSCYSCCHLISGTQGLMSPLFRSPSYTSYHIYIPTQWPATSFRLQTDRCTHRSHHEGSDSSAHPRGCYSGAQCSRGER
jgi:hypothetical protein